MALILQAILVTSILTAVVHCTSLPKVNLGYEIHQATFNVSLPALLALRVTDATQASGQYYNFSNIRYGAAPLGDLRFAAPKKPTAKKPVFSDGGPKAITCIQAIPAWTEYSLAWVTNGTAAFNISAGYQQPNITQPPPPDPDGT
jgi:hypothetical protein